MDDSCVVHYLQHTKDLMQKMLCFPPICSSSKVEDCCAAIVVQMARQTKSFLGAMVNIWLLI